jgi:hypothetical protein
MAGKSQRNMAGKREYRETDGNKPDRPAVLKSLLRLAIDVVVLENLKERNDARFRL